MEHTQMKLNDGGPAFPIDPHYGLGMTLRDYFAGQALAGYASKSFDFSTEIAKLAYEDADAMLKVRNAKS